MDAPGAHSVAPTSDDGTSAEAAGAAASADAPMDGENLNTDISSVQTAPEPSGHRLAGMLTSRRHEWRTPQRLWTRLDDEFHFDLDVAATSENRLRGTRPDNWDALHDAAKWGQVNYINPPYGRTIGAWLRAAYFQACNGAIVVVLVPARPDTRWWHQWVTLADEIRFIPGRLRFDDGATGAPFPSCVVVFWPRPMFREASPRVLTFTW